MIYPGQEPVGYQEVAEILRARIVSGQLKPGDRLPSERDLSQTYDVAPMTARAAVRLLRDEGLAEVARGRGVVVRALVEPEVVYVGPGDWVGARNPSPAERRLYRVPEGVPLMVVTHPDGLQDLYSADRYRVVYRPA
ncbi:winged helix-turn-helix domain-containing protein [Micromonospora sp. HUAS LYJ1]|uniref:winged helix-turn-helix domain-containing protein n=1 Tax=Micromonospora sp. HUAS LYJ1 TaxID=3061626 RepID=UPI0026731978|nr:winged helix-turn-helix domain-containing protein [Micromonospora sp. HUAS LYJ1]WKU05502.1 winged helix-turn-helix domain-containing protein [Micromonospora sp. HUAS LYJ1]